MDSQPMPPWGEWLKRRAFHLGIETQRELATKVGVSAQVVSGWFKADLPPRLRQSSVTKLAEVLKTHPDVIRHDFWRHEPSEAPDYEHHFDDLISSFGRDEILRLAKENGYHELVEQMETQGFHKKIKSFLEVMDAGQLRKVHDLCAELYLEAMENIYKDTGNSGKDHADAMQEESELWSLILEGQYENIMAYVKRRLRPIDQNPKDG